MAEFILLMHTDGDPDEAGWGPYLAALKATGRFEGGSAIGDGKCFRKTGLASAVSEQIGGYVKVEAKDLTEAAAMLAGNPVYESGGTVEIRELPRS